MKRGEFGKAWWTAPAVFAAGLLALGYIWAVMEPAQLVQGFDAHGGSLFEVATLPFYAAIVPFVWIWNPFGGPRRRRIALALAASVVAVMAVVKETDAHNALLARLYPAFVSESGSLVRGRLFKNKYKPVDGKKPALAAACAGLPQAAGDAQMVEVAEADRKTGEMQTVAYRVRFGEGGWLSAEGLSGTPFKMRTLTSPDVPVGMKALVVLYFTLFFGLFGFGFLLLFGTWLKGVFALDPACWAWGCLGASGVMVQVFDRLPAWLGHAGGLGVKAGAAVTGATSLCTCFEEGGEMLVAVFALMTIRLAYRAGREGEA